MKKILVIILLFISSISMYSQTTLLDIFISGNIDNKDLVILKKTKFNDLKAINTDGICATINLSNNNIKYTLDNDPNAVYQFIFTEKDFVTINKKTLNYFYVIPSKNNYDYVKINVDLNSSVLMSYVDSELNFNKGFKSFQNMYIDFWNDINKMQNLNEQAFIELYDKHSRILQNDFESIQLSDVEKIFLYSKMNPEIFSPYILNHIDNKSNNSMIVSLIHNLNKENEIKSSIFSINNNTFDINGNKINNLPNADYYFITFWASWCGPCRKHNKNEYAEFYKKITNYKSKKIEMISISLDRDEKKWREASETDNILWANYIDSNNSKSTYYNDYNFNSLPTIFLVDKNAKIIKKIDYLDLSPIEELID